jgi:co-chaperonin GroES (HSP10)
MIRPLHDWLLVKLEPLAEMRGSLFVPNAIRVRKGTVLRVGPGRWQGAVRVAPALAPGDRIAFFREHLEHQQGKQLVATLRELDGDLGLLRVPDVLFVLSDKEDVELSA